MYTYKTKTLPQSGANVLYCVCVWSLSLTSSNTQYGSLLPPMSADFKSWALSTAIQKYKYINIQNYTRVILQSQYNQYDLRKFTDCMITLNEWNECLTIHLVNYCIALNFLLTEIYQLFPSTFIVKLVLIKS